MPNALASLMLLLWPVACLVLLRRLPIERGVIWCILGGYLLLPPRANFDLPLVPPMDKDSIPAISAFLVAVFALNRKVPLLPKTPAARLLVLLFILGAIPTVLTNGDPAVYSDGTGRVWVVPGLRTHDTLSAVVQQMIVLLPFLLGRALLASEAGMREILKAMMLGGLIYSIPALIEIRLSPQMNVWVYGFFQHSFEQMMRDGGFRPLVFLPHALWLAFFMFGAVLSTAALAKLNPPPERIKLIFATIYLLGVLYLCKSLASQLYAISFLTLVLLTNPKMQIRATIILAIIAISYPMLRNAGLIPVDDILERAAAFSQERSDSMQYRFNNEELLLERAHSKSLFGWGGWGRNLLLDPGSGEILTVPDGRWIIVFGESGWLGYIAEMGLLATPLVVLWQRSLRHPGDRSLAYAAPIALILAANMVDMLVNATLIPLTWLFAGAILGFAENEARATSPTASPQGKPKFGRDPVIGRRTRPKGRRTIL